MKDTTTDQQKLEVMSLKDAGKEDESVVRARSDTQRSLDLRKPSPLASIVSENGHHRDECNDAKGQRDSRGPARFAYPDGAYTGEYIVKKHGFGRYDWKNGAMYEGGWQENKVCGMGTYSWPDGRQYQG